MRITTLTATFVALAGAAAAQENILILLGDDVGVDNIGAYAEGQDLPPTPNIDALAAGGVLFRNAWSNPVCSPTRAAIQTGRHGFRTGIGMALGLSPTSYALSTDEVILPELFDLNPDLGYAHAAIGKWHLGNASVGGGLSPNIAGYDHFNGTLGNFKEPYDYYFWPAWVNGNFSVITHYATVGTTEAARQWIETAPEPWICYVAFNAPHAPLHTPPDELYTVDLPNTDSRIDPRPYFRADVEAMDTEIGRLLASIDADTLGRTNVIFAGDNGTPAESTVAPFDPDHAKLTCYEGGVNVPLIVSGPSVVVPGREVGHIVSLVDLFSTVADMAGIDAEASLPNVELDSVSLYPYLEKTDALAQRQTVYAEVFHPNGPGPYEFAARTIRNERYKLIWFEIPTKKYALYNVVDDPWEQDNLLAGGTPDPVDLTAFRYLRNKMNALLGSGTGI
ncbi:MAG: sulfatase-like hydrolase/transferase [Planctomycetota bacterium]|jgi:arylsulfatase A-like enzyme|nr:sulfatase-like hydrolase/transferase [Planctomycetota bacterium]